MTEKMVNGILFIIAGIGSIAIYMVLGETGLLGKVHTEKIAAYALVTIPLAFMMTRNVARNPFIDTGLLIIVIGLTMGLVGDAINSTKISAESDLIAEAVGMTAWSIMYLGYFITGIGYKIHICIWNDTVCHANIFRVVDGVVHQIDTGIMKYVYRIVDYRIFCIIYLLLPSI